MNKYEKASFSTAEVLQRKQHQLVKRKSLSSLVMELLFTAAVICVLFFLVFGVGSVQGSSMYPSMRDGDLVVMYRLEHNLKVGDVVAFDHGNEEYIKRVEAVAGDVVNIDDDSGFLIVNGVTITDDIMFPTHKMTDNIQYPYTVPDGYVFVMGDNREKSADSRVFGAVRIKDIKGKIITSIRTRIL